MKKTLKLMVMLLCVAAFATFSSCSKDNDDLIVGKWKMTQKSDDGINWEDHIGVIYEFKSDGTFTSMGVSNTYTLNGNTLTVGSETYEIITLTNSELIWRYDKYMGGGQYQDAYQKFVKI